MIWTSESNPEGTDMTLAESRKILLAEDDASMRRFVTVILEKAGYEVVAVADGLAAVEAASQTVFDAVVADALMPSFSGFDLCRMIRATCGDRKIPCIIVSGLTENLDDGTIADAFVVKDANLKENLLAALKAVAGG